MNKMLLCLLTMIAATPIWGGDRLVVHEWGTFTVLQDDAGQELYGINIDDEPVPDFVHNLEPFILNTPVLSHDYWLSRQKGAPRFHPQVSMRLETPVIYFYPPANAELPLKLDVQVKFRGGWLTEFYPNAEVRLPGADQGEFDFSNLNSAAMGELAWKQLQVGTHGTAPKTTENVWLAPRRVAAANVTNQTNESEKFLFYRGVAQQSSAVKVVTKSDGDKLEISANFDNSLQNRNKLAIPQLWLMETRKDGASAYRALGSLIAKDQRLEVKRRFDSTEFAPTNREKLEREMHAALVADGLFAEEATAMLSTWQRAYFTTAGLRLFYIVPKAWTDHVLPLTISGEPTVTRVMIGRVELISDPQRKSLAELAKADEISTKWLDAIVWDSPQRRTLLAGRSNFGELDDVNVPAHFQHYLDLGRFRNALVVVEEQRCGPGKTSLTRFINDYQLHPFRLNRE